MQLAKFIIIYYRVNFTLEDLAPVAPAYDYFMSCMDSCSYPTGTEGTTISFSATQLSTDFEQYFEYERVRELVSKCKCTCIHI